MGEPQGYDEVEGHGGTLLALVCAVVHALSTERSSDACSDVFPTDARRAEATTEATNSGRNS